MTITNTAHSTASPTNGGVHVSHAYEWANAAARAAFTPVAADVGKIGLQLDTGALYIVRDDSPRTLALLTVADEAGSIVVAPAAHASTHHTAGSDALTISSIAGTISSGQHGSQAGGTLHSDVISAGASGFMTGMDKTKLDGLPDAVQTGHFQWGNDTIGTSATTRFLVPGYSETAAPTTSPAFRVPTAGTIQRLRVHHNNPGTGGATITYTLRKNGATQVLTCAMLPTAADASDLANSFTVAAGDLIDLQVTKSGAIATSPVDVLASVEFAP